MTGLKLVYLISRYFPETGKLEPVRVTDMEDSADAIAQRLAREIGKECYFCVSTIEFEIS